jgi:hypothetical protein
MFFYGSFDKSTGKEFMQLCMRRFFYAAERALASSTAAPKLTWTQKKISRQRAV